METIKDQIYSKDAPVKYKTIKYQCTGATYTGNMRGGFRDGKGVMKWADGAYYDG